MNTRTTIIKNAVNVVVADGNNAASVTTTGNSTELLQQQHQEQYQSSNNNYNNNNNNKINKMSNNLATIRSSHHQSHRTCPAHAYTHTKDLLSDAGILSAGCSDASTNSSAELLDMDVDEKIAPIFEEDIDEMIDEEIEEEEEDDDDESENDDDVDDDFDISEDDSQKAEDCVEIDVEHDDMEFCGASRKSTYSVKSSASRYDKLLTLTAPKQPAVMPTSKSFNDNSNATNTKLQQLRHKQQLKEQQKVQRWRGKFKMDKKQSTSSDAEPNKKHATAGSQKNIVKRALLSLASGGSGVGGGGDGNSGTRPKSTSSLKFGHNKLHFLAVGSYKSGNKNKKQQQQQQNSPLNSHETNEIDEEAEVATTSKQISIAATTTTTTTTTKSNLGNIITSLLRTTTL